MNGSVEFLSLLFYYIGYRVGRAGKWRGRAYDRWPSILFPPETRIFRQLDSRPNSVYHNVNNEFLIDYWKDDKRAFELYINFRKRIFITNY